MNKVIREYIEKMHWDITRWQLGISKKVEMENAKAIIDATGDNEGWI
jgi:hypothetical protein|tara:strand:+ start:409 stop:549 length:141 start_codon:yes stop_codon:yes gene_type:complete